MIEDAPYLRVPDDLSPLGQSAVETIIGLLIQNKATHTGGCRAFYSPQEWQKRGEAHGNNALLIVVHDGGEVGTFFDYDKESYARIEKMDEALRAVGAYAEPCTCWYTAIYATHPN